MTTNDILTVKNLTKRYGMQTVIRSLSFRLERGRRLALYAPSGAGKSTLINILARLESFDGGTFTLEENHPVTIFQEPRLFQFLSVEENIFLPLKIQDKQLSPELRRRYERWLDVTELAPYTRHYPHQLSGGMRQKVALVRGLLTNPAFVMMDEPFQSIGGAAKRRIMDLILETNPGISMLLVTHNLEEIPALAHSVLYFQSSPLGSYVEMEADALGRDTAGFAPAMTIKEPLPAGLRLIPGLRPLAMEMDLDR